MNAWCTVLRERRPAVLGQELRRERKARPLGLDLVQAVAIAREDVQPAAAGVWTAGDRPGVSIHHALSDAGRAARLGAPRGQAALDELAVQKDALRRRHADVILA